MIQYFCSQCNESVGKSQEPILEAGATVFCAKCSQLPILTDPFIVDLSTPQEGTELFNDQMASELEGSFLLLNGG